MIVNVEDVVTRIYNVRMDDQEIEALKNSIKNIMSKCPLADYRNLNSFFVNISIAESKIK